MLDDLTGDDDGRGSVGTSTGSGTVVSVTENIEEKVEQRRGRSPTRRNKIKRGSELEGSADMGEKSRKNDASYEIQRAVDCSAQCERGLVPEQPQTEDPP